MEHVYGTFTVTGEAPSKHGHTYVVAACKCGAAPRTVRTTLLRAGRVTCPCTPKVEAKVTPGDTPRLLVPPDLAREVANAEAFQELEQRVTTLEDTLAEVLTRLDALEARQQAGVVFGASQPGAVRDLARELQQVPATPVTTVELKTETTAGVPTRTHPSGHPPDVVAQARKMGANLPAYRGPLEYTFTVADIYKHGTKSAGREANVARIKHLSETPFPLRTPELKEELRVRNKELNDITDLMHRDVPTYDELIAVQAAAYRTLNTWENDPANE